jgi:hypothetical protein
MKFFHHIQSQVIRGCGRRWKSPFKWGHKYTVCAAQDESSYMKMYVWITDFRRVDLAYFSSRHIKENLSFQQVDPEGYAA